MWRRVCALALGYDKKAMLVGYEPAMDAGYEIKLLWILFRV